VTAQGLVSWIRTGSPSTPFGRLAVVHAVSAAGDALFAVSLAGSLFFNVSLDAARPQVILYLALTMAPFAIVAPLIGPLSDRFRGGHRAVVAVACVSRGIVCWLLAGDLRSLFLYPEAFALLVLGKTYSVSKNALVPHLVDDDTELVQANSRLTLLGLAGGAVAGALGSGLVGIFSAPWALRLGAFVFVAAALAALRVPRAAAAPPDSAVIEYESLHTPVIQLGAVAIGLLRAGVGFLLFLLGFALRREGEPAWVYGLLFAASGVGALIGSVAAPALRRRLREEGMLAAALALPAILALGGAIRFGRVALVIVPVGLGAAAAGGRQAFDALVQGHAPAASRGRAFARFETMFQLAWVLGALVPVVTGADARLGLGALGGTLAAGAVWFAISRRGAVRLDEGLRYLRAGLLDESPAPASKHLPRELLAAAERLASGPSPPRAAVEAVAALEVAVDQHLPDNAPAMLLLRLGEPLRAATGWSPTDDPDLWRRCHDVVALRTAAVRGQPISPDEALSAVATVQTVIERLEE